MRTKTHSNEAARLTTWPTAPRKDTEPNIACEAIFTQTAKANPNRKMEKNSRSSREIHRLSKGLVWISTSSTNNRMPRSSSTSPGTRITRTPRTM